MLDRRFVAFCAVGALNTAFGYSVFAGLVFAGLHRAWALLLATCVGVIFNFYSTGRIVFDNRGSSRLLRFVGAYGIVYLFNLALMEMFIEAGAGEYVAGGLSMLLATLAAYLLQSRFVFAKAK